MAPYQRPKWRLRRNLASGPFFFFFVSCHPQKINKKEALILVGGNKSTQGGHKDPSSEIIAITGSHWGQLVLRVWKGVCAQRHYQGPTPPEVCTLYSKTWSGVARVYGSCPAIGQTEGQCGTEPCSANLFFTASHFVADAEQGRKESKETWTLQIWQWRVHLFFWREYSGIACTWPNIRVLVFYQYFCRQDADQTQSLLPTYS